MTTINTRNCTTIGFTSGGASSRDASADDAQKSTPHDLDRKQSHAEANT